MLHGIKTTSKSTKELYSLVRGVLIKFTRISRKYFKHLMKHSV